MLLFFNDNVRHPDIDISDISQWNKLNICLGATNGERKVVCASSRCTLLGLEVGTHNFLPPIILIKHLKLELIPKISSLGIFSCPATNDKVKCL